jgi:hypothetical protein
MINGRREVVPYQGTTGFLSGNLFDQSWIVARRA